MPGKKSILQQVQVGDESTWGTAVAQELELAGVESLEISDWFTTLANREMGSLAPNQRGASITQVGGAASMSMRASYDHIGVILDSLLGTATPSGVGPYVRAYTAPLTAQPTRKFFTLAKGDGDDCYSLLGALVSNLTLTWEQGQYVMASVNWVGKNVATDTLDSVSPAAVDWLVSQNCTVSIGTYGGSLSALDCNIKRAELVFNSGTFVDYGLGSISGCDYNYGDVECSLKIMGKASYSTIKTLVESHMGTTPTLIKREIRLNTTTGANDILQIDFSGYLSSPPVIFGDEDGLATFELEFAADYDASTNLTSFLDISLTNGVADYYA